MTDIIDSINSDHVLTDQTDQFDQTDQLKHDIKHDIRKISYDLLFPSFPKREDLKIKINNDFIKLNFIFQNSNGLRIFTKSPNAIYSLCANIYGDLWIGSSYGEIRWIYRNPSYLVRNIYSLINKFTNIPIGQPNIIYTKKGLFVFLLDDKVLYYANNLVVRSSINKSSQNQAMKHIVISKYHIKLVSNSNINIPESEIDIGLSLNNKGQLELS
jgi:hypothetical protein